ncbi:MAG: LamG-like jellyroll fold domain-containing protein [Vicinamibacterales bacterium]
MRDPRYRPRWPFRPNYDSAHWRGLLQWFAGGGSYRDLVTGGLLAAGGSPTVSTFIEHATREGMAYRTIPNNNYYSFPPLTVPVPFTIAWWGIRVGTANHIIYQSSDGLSSNHRGVQLALGGGVAGVWYCRYNDASGQNRAANGPAALPTATILHLVAVCRGATDWSLYIDGQPVSPTYTGTGGAIGTGTANGTLGRGPNSVNAQDAYTIDLRVWDHALEEYEVKSLYAPDTRWDLYWTPGRRSVVVPAGGGGTPVPAGSLALTGQAPRLVSTLGVAAAALALTGLAPTVSIDERVTPAPATLTLSGQAPALDHAVRVEAGTLTLTGTSPALAFTLPVGAGALTLEGAAPTRSVTLTRAPDAGTLTLTGLAPGLGLAVPVDAGALTLTGAEPTLSVSGGGSFEFQIAANDDDAFQAEGGTTVVVDELGVPHAVGTGVESDTPDRYVAWRWTLTGIAQGAVIESATLRLIKSGDEWSPIYATVYGEDADSAAAFTSGTLSGRTLTTANTVVDDNISELDGTARDIDVTAIVQEIVDRPGWDAGQVLALIAVGDGVSSFARKNYHNFSTDEASAATLILEVAGGESPPSPGPGTLTLTGLAPALALTLPVAAGELALAGAAPALALAMPVAAGELTLAGAPPSLAAVIAVDPATLAVSGLAPALDLAMPIAAGVLTLAGAEPTANVASGIPVEAGTLTLTGLAPSLDDTIPVGAGTLTLTGPAPALVSAGAVAPDAGTLTLTGLAPSLRTTVTPDAAVIVLTGAAPTLPVTVSPAAAVVVIEGAAPRLAFDLPVTAGELVLGGTIAGLETTARPAAAALSLTGVAPSLTGASTAVPDAGVLTLTGLAPALVEHIIIAVPAGALTLEGLAPSLSAASTLEHEGEYAFETVADGEYRFELDHDGEVE